METTLRPTTPGGAASTLGTRTSASTTLTPVRSSDTQASDQPSTQAPAPSQGTLRASGSTRIGSGLQSQVARAQQALDYLNRVSSQLEALKGELTAKLSGATASRQQLEAQVRQLTQTLQSRRKTGGGSVDANLNYTTKPAEQNFTIRGMDLDALRQSAPQSIAFSVGSAGGPQTSIDIDPNQSDEEIARAIDRAMAPMGVRARADDKGGLVFSTPEANWPAVKDSIAVSGRGKVQTDETPPAPLPQGWDTSNTDALRQNLREVVQALERVRRSQAAASEALSSANMEITRAETPPPEIDLATDAFSNAAQNTDYDSLLSLSSALVGVSRERVLALLGLR